MPATIRQIVDDATRVIGEVAGIGVQTYAEDDLFKHAVRGFNLVFKKRHWEQYRRWTTVVLDGTTGVPTTDAFEQVIDFEDFIAVHRAGEERPLPVLPKGKNPNTLTGTRPIYWSSLYSTHAHFDKRKILVFPATSTGSIDVLARVYPLVPPAISFDWEDIFDFDRDLLVYATSFAALIGDALNADAAETMRTLMEMKYKDIVNGLSSHPVPIYTHTGIPNQWSERP